MDFRSNATTKGSPAASTRGSKSRTRALGSPPVPEKPLYAVNLKRAILLSLPLTGKKEKNDETIITQTIIRVGCVLVCKYGVAGVAVSWFMGSFAYTYTLYHNVTR